MNSQSIRDRANGVLSARKGMRKDAFLAALAIVATVGAGSGAVAQLYPVRPITMIVPFAAGGPTDVLARVIAEPMRASLGQPVIITNVSGAAGTIATSRVVHEKADGYTVIIGNWGTHVINGAIQPLQYDLLKDFEPVALIATNPHVIVSRNGVPAKDLGELIGWVHANQDHISGANSGIGSPSHVSGLYFQRKTNTHFPFVPFRGSGPALQELVAGRIDLYFDQVSNALAHIRSGEIKAYAIAAKQRLTAAPDIPSVDEAGLPGFHISVWHALWLPKGASKDVVAKLNTAIMHALQDNIVRQRLADLGQEVVSIDQQTPEALAAYQSSEIGKWWPIIRSEKLSIQ